MNQQFKNDVPKVEESSKETDNLKNKQDDEEEYESWTPIRPKIHRYQFNNDPNLKIYTGENKLKRIKATLQLDNNYTFKLHKIFDDLEYRGDISLKKAMYSNVDSKMDSIYVNNNHVYFAMIIPSIRNDVRGSIVYYKLDKTVLYESVNNLKSQSSNINDNIKKHIIEEHVCSFAKQPVSISIRRFNDSIVSLIGFQDGKILIASHANKLKPKSLRMYSCDSLIDAEITKVQWIQDDDSLFLISFSNGKIFTFNMDYPDLQFNEAYINEYYLKNNLKNKNPISCWNISNVSILDFQFSPCLSYFSTAGRDGKLCIFDYQKKQLLCIFKSYYGGIKSIDWSHDSKIIIAGGEDDIISIWSFKLRQLIARGYGHSSFIKKVKFMPSTGNDNHNYHFVSIGDDCKGIFWNLNDVILSDNNNNDQQNKKEKEDDFDFVLIPSSNNTKMVNNITFISKDDSCTIIPMKQFYASSVPCSDILFIENKFMLISSWGGRVVSYCNIE